MWEVPLPTNMVRKVLIIKRRKKEESGVFLPYMY